MSGDTEYCYPPSYTVLKNKLNIRDAKTLDRFERHFVVERIAQGIPQGDFNLAHLRAIHRHLFQDIFEWAGELRTVEISKGGHQFQFRRFIETGMADIHRRLTAQNFLRGLSAQDFAHRAGEILGDVNYVHPFREGNGRTQLFYLEQLAERAGHPLDLRRLDKAAWMEASRQAHLGRYAAMSECIAAAIRPANDEK
jgi:cell filamentation protein